MLQVVCARRFGSNPLRHLNIPRAESAATVELHDVAETFGRGVDPQVCEPLFLGLAPSGGDKLASQPPAPFTFGDDQLDDLENLVTGREDALAGVRSGAAANEATQTIVTIRHNGPREVSFRGITS